MPRRRPTIWLATWLATSLASCTSPHQGGTFLRRERHGAVILHLLEPATGHIDGDISLTRLGPDGGMHVFARKFTGARNGDSIALRDTTGAAFSVILAADAARVTAPDGSVMTLARSDSAQETALLAGLSDEATRMSKGQEIVNTM